MVFSREQTTVPGPQWWESIIPEDRNLMASALAASNENDAPFDLEFRIALNDGRQRWLYSRGGVSRDASGKALRVHGASIDVTERKRADEKLRESEGHVRRAIFRETWSRMIFYSLGRLGEGNRIVLKNRIGRTYEYRVSETFLAVPNDSWVMEQLRGRNMLTLQTCTPIPTLQKRLIVRAARV